MNVALSPVDKANCVISYLRPQPHPSAPVWSLEYALGVAGVDEITAKAILAERSSPLAVCALYNAWKEQYRVTHPVV